MSEEATRTAMLDLILERKATTQENIDNPIAQVAAFWRTWVADEFCLVSLAEALSRAVPDTDCRVIL